ncbi:DUF1289 domain-containing protein [Agrobacterium pusense]|uniref:DUF1289 domain-containing protein n=1 Tax=Agrobacterium pusense TaxID=648995 RepID=UPI0022B92010|nr:DUF1289 domain-containing protein [Agrobacterium pusense]MCZ7929413.1 DUF1289 domain-containing protein [Agrobacterium pusense]
METPCVQICRLDTTHTLCIGCGRTLYEIGGWTGYSDETRRLIMRALPQRLANLSESAKETHTA